MLFVYGTASAADRVTLGDEKLSSLVEHSYQYVIMYNVNNKFAMKQGGWNTCLADTRLKDHTFARSRARTMTRSTMPA